MQRIIIDEVTGEVLAEIGEGDRIVRATTINYLQETVEWGKGETFMKVFDSELMKVAPFLTGTGVLVLIKLFPYVAYGSGLLCHRNNGNSLNNEDIEAIAGLSAKGVYNVMEELVKNKVLFKGRTGNSNQYYGNPYIFCRGQRINKTLEQMFKHYKFK